MEGNKKKELSFASLMIDRSGGGEGKEQAKNITDVKVRLHKLFLLFVVIKCFKRLLLGFKK